MPSLITPPGAVHVSTSTTTVPLLHFVGFLHSTGLSATPVVGDMRLVLLADDSSSDGNPGEDWEELVRNERRQRRQLAEDRERHCHAGRGERRKQRKGGKVTGETFEIRDDIDILPSHTTTTSALRKRANAAAPQVLRLVRFFDDSSDDDDAAPTTAAPEKASSKEDTNPISDDGAAPTVAVPEKATSKEDTNPISDDGAARTVAVPEKVTSEDDPTPITKDDTTPRGDAAVHNTRSWTLPKLNLRKLCTTRVRMQALTPAERETLDRAVAAETVVRGPGYSLSGADFAQLVDVAGWLDDTVVDAYVKLINARNLSFFPSNTDLGGSLSEVTAERVAVNPQSQISTRTQALARGTRNRSYAFGSFFFKILCPTRARYNYSSVRGWTTGPEAKKRGCARERAKIRILDYSQLLVPVNIGSTHWVLAVVHFARKEFVYMDSLGTRDGVRGVVRTLRRWVADEVTDKYGEETMKQLDIGSWETVENPYYMPHQTDCDSCGMFCLGIAECLQLGVLPDFTQDDIPLLRQRAALALHRGSLPPP